MWTACHRNQAFYLPSLFSSLSTIKLVMTTFIFWMRKETREVQERAQGHPGLCKIQNQVCNPAWAPPRKPLSTFFWDWVDSQEIRVCLLPQRTPVSCAPDNILPPLWTRIASKFKSFSHVFTALAHRLTNSYTGLHKRNHFNINSAVIWELRVWGLLWQAEGILVTYNSGFQEAHNSDR